MFLKCHDSTVMFDFVFNGTRFGKLVGKRKTDTTERWFQNSIRIDEEEKTESGGHVGSSAFEGKRQKTLGCLNFCCYFRIIIKDLNNTLIFLLGKEDKICICFLVVV